MMGDSCRGPEGTIPRGITRYEYNRSRGWLARVHQKGARKLFSDGVYGNEQASLEAAVEWQRAERASVAPRERKRQPGYGYVQETVRRYRTVSGELRSYAAFEVRFWDAEGRPCSTSYGIETHGEKEARERCEAWLHRARAAMTPEPPSMLSRTG